MVLKILRKTKILSNPTLFACSGLCAIASIVAMNKASASNIVVENIVSYHCPPFDTNTFYRPPTNTLIANPGNWIRLITEAKQGDEILLEDGTYRYDRYAVGIDKPITIRSKSGNPQNVVIQGRGYGDEAEGLVVMADDVQIADLTIQDVHHHAISLNPGVSNAVVYNVNLVDIGTQHIKGNRSGPNGLIACSNIGYTDQTGAGDYNGGIDLHAAVNWTIRDNNIYNIFGDGSGCVVDRECGSQFQGGGAAILLWQNSKDNTVERNTITESFRGISLGLNTPYSGGVVRNNFIYRALDGREGINGYINADAGISLIGAASVVVEGNTVLLAGDYPGAIEVWKATGNTIKNNMISKPVWNRGDASYNHCMAEPTGVDCDTSEYGNVVVDNLIQLTDNTRSNQPSKESMPKELGLVSDAPADLQANTDANALTESDISAAQDSTNETQEVFSTNGTDSHELTVELLNRYENLLLQMRKERLLMMADLLKFKEERLLLQEADLKRRTADVNR